MVHHDRSLVPVPSYLRDLYQLITLLLSDRRVVGIADFRALSEVNHEAEVNRLLIWIATAISIRETRMKTQSSMLRVWMDDEIKPKATTAPDALRQARICQLGPCA